MEQQKPDLHSHLKHLKTMEKIYENKGHSKHCTSGNEGQQTLRYKRNNEMSPIIAPSELPIKNFFHSETGNPDRTRRFL